MTRRRTREEGKGKGDGEGGKKGEVGGMAPVAVLGKNIGGGWPLIIWEATTAKRNLL